MSPDPLDALLVRMQAECASRIVELDAQRYDYDLATAWVIAVGTVYIPAAVMGLAYWAWRMYTEPRAEATA